MIDYIDWIERELKKYLSGIVLKSLESSINACESQDYTLSLRYLSECLFLFFRDVYFIPEVSYFEEEINLIEMVQELRILGKDVDRSSIETILKIQKLADGNTIDTILLESCYAGAIEIFEKYLKVQKERDNNSKNLPKVPGKNIREELDAILNESVSKSKLEKNFEKVKKIYLKYPKDKHIIETYFLFLSEVNPKLCIEEIQNYLEREITIHLGMVSISLLAELGNTIEALDWLDKYEKIYPEEIEEAYTRVIVFLFIYLEQERKMDLKKIEALENRLLRKDESFFKYVTNVYDIFFEREVPSWKRSNGFYFFKEEKFIHVLQKWKKDREHNSVKSDFLIQTSKKIDGKIPLALGNEIEDNSLVYFSNLKWNQKYTIPFFDPKPLVDRTLPGTDIQYPYLTVDDFLESELVMLDSSINSGAFLSGNSGSRGYLLPLKPLFFDYFSVTDLNSKVLNLDRIEFINDSKNVKVLLRIPIQKNFVLTFEKLYCKEDIQKKGSLSVGKLNNFVFLLGITPLLANSPIPSRMIVFSDNDREFELILYNLSNIPHKNYRTLTRTHFDLENTIFFDFDQSDLSYIQFRFRSGVNGIVVPNYEKFFYRNNSIQFQFSVNMSILQTDINYSTTEISDFLPFQKEYSLTENNMMEVLCDTRDLNLKRSVMADLEVIANETFPFDFSKSKVQFPIENVLMMTPIPENERNYLWDTNIAFLYRKIYRFPGAEYRFIYLTDSYLQSLDHDKKSEKDLRLFIEELLFLLYVKTIKNNGDLNQIMIRITYPMYRTLELNLILRSLWMQSYNTITRTKNSSPLLEFVSEETAVFNYFLKEGKADKDCTTILFNSGFESFASVSLFSGTTQSENFFCKIPFPLSGLLGDGLGKSPSPENNAWIRLYKNKFREFLKKDKEGLLDYFDNELFKKKKESIYWIKFFLFDIGEYFAKQGNFIGMEILTHDYTFTYIYQLYISIIYYYSLLKMKFRGTIPGNSINLLFSGDIYFILQNLYNYDESKSMINILQKINQKVFPDIAISFQLIYESNSHKSIYSKGALSISKTVSMETEYRKLDNNSIFLKDKTNFRDIQIEDVNLVVQAVMEFLNSYKDIINEVYKFKGNKFIKVFESLLESSNHLDSMKSVQIDKNSDSTAEGGLFFHPFIAMLHKLSNTICSER